MNTIFEMAGKTIQKKILLTAHFELGRCGRINIYTFDRLEVKNQHGERVHYEVVGGKQWTGSQEAVDWKDRDQQPSARMSAATYLPYPFGRLDIITNSDGSRFFSLKEASGCSLSTSADEYPDREVAVILSDREELEKYLDEILDKMGVPTSEDIRQVKKDLLTKLF